MAAGILGYTKSYTQNACLISSVFAFNNARGQQQQWRIIMFVMFMTEGRFNRLVKKAVREELKTSSYAFWASCMTNDIDVDDLMKVVKGDRDKLEKHDREFAALVRPHIPVE